MVLEIYIDPSYTGTGVSVIKREATGKVASVEFALFSSSRKKQFLNNYFSAAYFISESFYGYLRSVLSGELQPFEKVKIYLEAPFPLGQASSGLYLLQGLLILSILDIKDVYKGVVSDFTVFSVPPSLVHQFVRKFSQGDSDSVKIRKRIVSDFIKERESSGTVFKNVDLCIKKGGVDVATSYLFFEGLLTYSKELVELDLDYNFSCDSFTAMDIV